MGFFNWSAPLFGRFADRWDDAGIEQIAEWLRPFVAPGGHLLDVGGGTGALASHMATALDADVTILDPTPQMLAYVPSSPRIHPVQGVAEAAPFDNDAFDAVIVTDAFHHFRDQPGAVREFARVVRCGGGVVVIELDPSPWYMRPIVAAEKLLGEPGAFFTQDGMCTFMSENGIAGHCKHMRGPEYRYTGTVK